MTRLLMVSVVSGRSISRTRRRLRRREAVPDPEAEIQVTDRRDVEPSQDAATYRCGCGYVFEAPVSTTVACPHCGDAQAW